MPSDVNRLIRAFSDQQAFSYPCPPGNNMLRRTVNPPPPPPVITVIMLYGPRDASTGTIIQHLAADLGGFQHFNIGTHLIGLNGLPHDDPYKKKALCNLDRYALEDLVAQNCYPPELLLVEIIKHHIDEEVAASHRRFLISGMPEETGPLWWFTQKVAEPNAIIFLQGSQSKEWRERAERVARHYKATKNDKVLIVPAIKGDTPRTYQNLISALARKAHGSKKQAQQEDDTDMHNGSDSATTATPVGQDAKIDRKDTPMQHATGEDLLDNLENALKSAPDR